MRKFLTILFLYFFIENVFCQNIKFTVEADQIVSKDSYFELAYKVNNVDCAQFEPPVFNDFIVLGGPNQSTSITSINGKTTSLSTYVFILEPKKIGHFTIPPAQINCNGVTYKSNSFDIEVNESKNDENLNKSIQNGGNILVRFETNLNSAYTGQQVIVDIKLYTKVQIDNFSIEEGPKISNGFYVEYQNFNAGIKQEKINGKSYYTKILKRFAIFPLKSGASIIEPLQVILGIPRTGTDDPFSAFFGTTERITYKTNRFSLPIKSLPEPIPPNFSGAVGNFTCALSCDKLSLNTNEVANLQFTVIGDGDIKRLKSPELISNDIFDIFPAKLAFDNTLEENGKLVFQQKYIVQAAPLIAGDTSLSIPNFVFFDPIGARFKTVNFNSLKFEISQGKSNPKIDTSDVTPKPNSSHIVDFHIKNAGKIVLASLLAIILGILVYSLIRKRKSKNLQKLDIAIVKNYKKEEKSENLNFKIVKKTIPAEIIQKLETLLQNGEIQQFYKSGYSEIELYLIEKLNISRSEFSHDKVKQNLINSNQTEQLQWISILNELEKSVYGGFQNEGEASQMLERIKVLLK